MTQALAEVEPVVCHRFTMDRLVRGKVDRIHTPNRIEVTLDLGFGVHLARHFVLDGLAFRKESDGKIRQAAHRCLITLLGGKSVLVLPESRSWSCKYARIYLTERIHGTPVGLIAEIPGIGRPILEVVPFMLWLAGTDFDVKRVREVVQGKR